MLRFSAAILTPGRQEFLDKKFAAVPLRIRMVLFDVFRNQAEHLEWALGLYKTNPEVFDHSGSVLGLKTQVQKLADKARWWGKAGEVRDPRISQHPEFHPKRKWDIGAYSPAQLDTMRARFPTPTKARELILTHETPVKVIHREERQDGIWEMVEIDPGDQTKREYERQLRGMRDYIIALLGQIAEENTIALAVEKTPCYINLKTQFLKFKPDQIYPKVDGLEVVQQDIVLPIRKQGWLVQEIPTAVLPTFRFFAPALGSYMKALCRYGEGTSWCTTQAENAVAYLQGPPLYITLHDGYPVAQGTPEDDSSSSELQDRNSEAVDHPVVRELFRDYTTVSLTVFWAPIQDYLEELMDSLPEIDPYDYIGKASWISGLNNVYLNDAADIFKLSNDVQEWGSTPGKDILGAFIDSSEDANVMPRHLETVISDILDGHGSDAEQNILDEAHEWLNMQAFEAQESLVSWGYSVEQAEQEVKDLRDELLALYELPNNDSSIDWGDFLKKVKYLEAHDPTYSTQGMTTKIEELAAS